ncbi:MAG: sensor hybrid histidine kinase [Proteobacteria bacterium]|nr:sensor hybrid histidine kinase [Pseudomonadota bacterium]
MSPDGLPYLPGIDKADGLQRMMNKPALYEKILRDFHARLIDVAALIRAEASAGNFNIAERQAHSAKGLAGAIGAHTLQAAALDLELALHTGSMPEEDYFSRFENELTIVLDGIAIGFGITASQ